MVTALRLSFRSVENVELRKWVRMASLADKPPEILSERQLRDRLNDEVISTLEALKKRLPKGSKISIALDNWQSPNKIAFMGILG